MANRPTTYYKLVPYFEQLGIKYASFKEIHKETKVRKDYLYRSFEIWLDRERKKREDFSWFRGLEKPEQFSSNEMDYGTQKPTYKYEDLSKEEKEIYNK